MRDYAPWTFVSWMATPLRRLDLMVAFHFFVISDLRESPWAKSAR